MRKLSGDMKLGLTLVLLCMLLFGPEATVVTIAIGALYGLAIHVCLVVIARMGATRTKGGVPS